MLIINIKITIQDRTFWTEEFEDYYLNRCIRWYCNSTPKHIANGIIEISNYKKSGEI